MCMATGGGNAFPIIRHAVVLRDPNPQQSGKPCRRANILGVNLGIPVKSAVGASLAIPFPSTPMSAQAFLALVGPKSGPPCFLLPPTRVGAILLAFVRHSPAVVQPFSAIKSYKVSPTVRGGTSEQVGNSKVSSMSRRTPMMTTLGRSCGTPKSDEFSNRMWWV